MVADGHSVECAGLRKVHEAVHVTLVHHFVQELEPWRKSPFPPVREMHSGMDTVIAGAGYCTGAMAACKKNMSVPILGTAFLILPSFVIPCSHWIIIGTHIINNCMILGKSCSTEKSIVAPLCSRRKNTYVALLQICL